MMSQRNPTWDLGRFVKTLSYYGAIPFLSDLDWFQEWLGSRPNPKVDSASMITPVESMKNSDGTIVLVAGTGAHCSADTARVAPQVTQKLMELGIRALPWTIEQPPTAELRSQVGAILLDAGDKTSEYIQAFQTTPFGQIYPLFDFTQYSSNLKEVWGALDDVVMGGVSESSIRFKEAIAEFSGNVSTANSGGFASVRTRNFDPAIDLSAYDGVTLRVKGDGNRYKFMLRTESRWDGVAHCHSFDTVADTWMTVRIPFSEFIPVLRAKTVPGATFDVQSVNAFQLMLSKFEYDGALNPHFQPGLFRLQIEAIGGYAQLPHLIIVSDNPQVNNAVRQSGMSHTLIHSGDGAVDSCLNAINSWS
jgi:Complex I intermediate-associated protein 30 (CIA30)